MSSSDSYEVHVSQDGRWSLAEVVYDREAAIQHARVLAEETGAPAARVLWSRFDAAADVFTERTIYKHVVTPESGVGAIAPLMDTDDEIGCRVGTDLYRPEARMAIHHALATALDRRKITVLELLHDWQHARAIYDASSVIQGAVQRHVFETARPGGPPATQRIKRLYAVIDEANLALHRLAHTPDRPVLGPQGLGQLVEAWSEHPDSERIIFSALSGFLRQAKEWPDKLHRLAEALSPAPRAAELRYVDEIATEVLGARQGLAAFIGPRRNGVEAVLALIAAVDSTEDQDTLTPEAAALRKAAGGMVKLTALRNALARRARRIAESSQPLGADAVAEEVQNIHLLWRAVDATAHDSPLRRLLPPLERRALRQMSAERLGVLLARIPEPWRRVECLLELEGVLIGTAAKAELAKYLHTVLADRAAPPGLDERQDNPAESLRRLRRWQLQLRETSFPEAMREELSRLVDRNAVRFINERRLVELLAKRYPAQWEQALALMELVLTDHFTHGEAMRLAKDRMLACLKSNGGVQALQEAMRGNDAIATKGRAMYDFLAAAQSAAQ
jgi:hypothetical protein